MNFDYQNTVPRPERMTHFSTVWRHLYSLFRLSMLQISEKNRILNVMSQPWPCCVPGTETVARRIGILYLYDYVWWLVSGELCFHVRCNQLHYSHPCTLNSPLHICGCFTQLLLLFIIRFRIDTKSKIAFDHTQLGFWHCSDLAWASWVSSLSATTNLEFWRFWVSCRNQVQ